MSKMELAKRTAGRPRKETLLTKYKHDREELRSFLWQQMHDLNSGKVSREDAIAQSRLGSVMVNSWRVDVAEREENRADNAQRLKQQQLLG